MSLKSDILLNHISICVSHILNFHSYTGYQFGNTIQDSCHWVRTKGKDLNIIIITKFKCNADISKNDTTKIEFSSYIK